MRHIMLLSIGLFLSISLIGCQQNENPQKPSINESRGNRAEVTDGDFVYRLITKKRQYVENEPIKLYAKLQYIGDKAEIEITHAHSPFYFPIVETTRNYEIHYFMDLPLATTKLVTGESLRFDYQGGGGYSSEDEKDYIAFMKHVMNDEFPKGYYIANGFVDFSVMGDHAEKKDYHIEGQVEFDVHDGN
ncbi:hypothetical protein [Lysinibacillus sp. LZ02]|uniref:hypothetical protein n=1 Tax=Lysinibacillus sp. LZ02 TaxID=3420668 RepID=UPI003D3620EC